MSQAETADPTLPIRPKVTDAAISVVLVAHDAAAPAEAVVDRWLTHLKAGSREHEVLLVGPATVTERPGLRVLPCDRPGFGAALRVGIAAARHPLLCHAPCDELVPPAELDKLLAVIDQVDLASGYRAGLPLPSLFRLTGLMWRWFIWIFVGLTLEPLPGWLGRESVAYQKLIRALFGVRVLDVDSPLKLFRRSVFDRIPLQSDGEFVHAEILAKMNFLGYIKGDYIGFAMEETPIAVVASWQSDPRRWAELRRVFNTPEFTPNSVPNMG